MVKKKVNKLKKDIDCCFTEDGKWLFFDVGYTLVNEDKVHKKRVEETVRLNKGFSYDDIYNAMIEASKDYKQPYPTAVKKLNILNSASYDHSLERPYEDAEFILSKLHRVYKIGIIANQSRGTEERLKSYGLLDYIDLIVSSEEEGVSKPDLRIFKLALDKAGVMANEAIMIGDRLDNDIYPVKTVGMKTIWIKQGLGAVQKPRSEEYKSDYEIDKLSDIVNILL